MACLRSTPQAHIICYISRDNLRCGAISNYLLYTEPCLSFSLSIPLFFIPSMLLRVELLLLLISSSRSTLSHPIPLSFRGRSLELYHRHRTLSFSSSLAFPLEKSYSGWSQLRGRNWGGGNSTGVCPSEADTD